jgi:hypothetical protein
MPQTRWLFVGAVMAVAAVALLVATLGRGNPVAETVASPSVLPPTGRSSAAPGTTTPTVDPTATATAAPPSTTAAPAPSKAPPRASGPPRLAWAKFLARLNEDRSTVGGLNAALTTAAQNQDTDAVKAASVDILDFVDVERDWLRDHPPADCYADAHGAAAAMLDAYGAAADRFIAWTTTGGGLGGLPALGDAVAAADAARAAFETFVAALEGTTCPN